MRNISGSVLCNYGKGFPFYIIPNRKWGRGHSQRHVPIPPMQIIFQKNNGWVAGFDLNRLALNLHQAYPCSAVDGLSEWSKIHSRFM